LLDAALSIIGVILHGWRGVERHVAGRVVLVVRAAGGVEPVVRVRRGNEIFPRAGAGPFGLVGEVAPGVVGIVIAPVGFESAHDGPAAVGPLVPGRKQAVQRVIGKDLAATVVAVVDDAPDVAVVAAAQMKVIGDVKNIPPVGGIGVRAVHGQAGGAGGHTAGLQALVVGERDGVSAEAGALAADESGQREVRPVTRRLRKVDAAAQVLSILGRTYGRRAV